VLCRRNGERVWLVASLCVAGSVQLLALPVVALAPMLALHCTAGASATMSVLLCLRWGSAAVLNVCAWVSVSLPCEFTAVVGAGSGCHVADAATVESKVTLVLMLSRPPCSNRQSRVCLL
jgi:hypothetical protein